MWNVGRQLYEINYGWGPRLMSALRKRWILLTHRHANIFINTGGATAADVRALIRRCQEAVEGRTGYRLEVEIGLVGEF